MTGSEKLEARSRIELIDEVRALRQRVEALETDADADADAGAESRMRLLRLVADNVPASISYIDEDERYLIVNRRYETVHCLSADVIEGMTLKELVGEASYRERETYLRRAQAGKRVTFDLDRDYRGIGQRTIEITYLPDIDADGHVRGLFCMGQDVTEARKVEQALRESETRLAKAQKLAQIGNSQRNMITGEVIWSDELYSILGQDPASYDPSTRKFGDIVHPDDRALFDEHYLGLGEDELTHDIDVRVVRSNGDVRDVHILSEPVYDESGGHLFRQATIQDVTDRVAVERALKDSEQNLRGIMDNVADGVATISEAGVVRSFNPSAEAMFGYSASEMVGNKIELLMPEPDRSSHDAYIQRYLDTGIGRLLGKGPRDVEGQRKDGSVFPMSLAVSEMQINGERIFIGAMRDVSERKRVERDLKESEARLARAQKIARLGYWWWDIETDQSYFSVEQSRQFGVDPAASPPSYRDFLNLVHPDDRGAVALALKKVIALEAPYDIEYRLVRPDGETRHFYAVGEVELNVAGKPTRLSGITQDITERRQVEEQLRQAQKMEAVGQLTGGVAHDFNNLLAVMLGNLELVQDRAGADEQTNVLIERALKAIEKCASLTSRLLAFSRKQALQPTAVEAGRLIAGMTDMLHRTLGETIEIHTVISDDLWSCDADPSQLESAVLNLALNARGAMPGGGRLDVEAANVTLDESYVSAQPEANLGDYVVLSVTDTGTGIAPDVLDHVFEPFFTTKGVGEGSGLGLSMVYGFASQSGGHATIQSAPGEGTTVRIYLPRSTGPEADAADAQIGSADAALPTSHSERVLLVEDDHSVRALVAALLGDLGYAFVEAANGAAALDVLAQSQPIDLLLTDVVLPGGMTGIELADEIRRRQPSIRVQLMSGYARTPADALGQDELTRRLLNKPFRKADFAAAIRRALDSQDEGVAS